MGLTYFYIDWSLIAQKCATFAIFVLWVEGTFPEYT